MLSTPLIASLISILVSEANKVPCPANDIAPKNLGRLVIAGLVRPVKLPYGVAVRLTADGWSFLCTLRTLGDKQVEAANQTIVTAAVADLARSFDADGSAPH